ncbi:hypothetical protein [Limnobacter parvus]|uniref:Hypersensitivity response secretion-like HrpJ domain-containing protein n=1 Tax=Limnobacter parvus TaxID=2939690 RepID=A0ABT1XJA5_9BURK|nr:hypothetical protein [Limnobacter parvus]MCR2747239.1 hypothetical protein [Limnobacter parvus]
MAVEVKGVPQVVTAQEALQSGQRPQNTLTTKEKSKVGRFVEAHRTSKTGHQPDAVQQIRNAELGKPQISAAEQMAAVASSGRLNRPGSSSRKFFKQMYKVLFIDNEDFLNRDLLHFVKSLKQASSGFVESSSTLSQDQKTLRKYLLAEIGQNTDFLSQSDQRLLNAYKANLSAAEEDFIQQSIAAFKSAASQPMKRVSQREFVKAFAVMDTSEAETSNELARCFKLYAHLIDAPDFVSQMKMVRHGLIDLLKRENVKQKKGENRTREHQIASRINAINLLIKSHLINKKFLDVCNRSALKSLPKLSALVEHCYQIVVAIDLVAGVTALIKASAQVKGEGKQAKGVFIANFDRLVLQSDLYKDLYKNSAHRQHIVDAITKHAKAFAVLSPGEA